jgi:hypothetical protein
VKLIVEAPGEAGREIDLARGQFSIGRGSDCDLVLRETEASRHHAELRRHGEQWSIVDLGSTNGTFVGNLRLTPDRAQPISPGVLITIGRTRLSLREEPQDTVVASQPQGRRAEAVAEGAPEEAPGSTLYALTAWVCRAIVLVGCALLVMGALGDWIRVQVRLPLVGTVLDRTLSGRDSGQAWLLFGLAAVAGLLVVLDIAGRRWGLAAGLGQALMGLAVAGTLGAGLYRYYQVGTQEFLGISLLDVFSRYARNVATITIRPGVYLAASGLAALIVGGLLRVVVAVAAPSED